MKSKTKKILHGIFHVLMAIIGIKWKPIEEEVQEVINEITEKDGEKISTN